MSIYDLVSLRIALPRQRKPAPAPRDVALDERLVPLMRMAQARHELALFFFDLMSNMDEVHQVKFQDQLLEILEAVVEEEKSKSRLDKLGEFIEHVNATPRTLEPPGSHRKRHR